MSKTMSNSKTSKNEPGCGARTKAIYVLVFAVILSISLFPIFLVSRWYLDAAELSTSRWSTSARDRLEREQRSVSLLNAASRLQFEDFSFEGADFVFLKPIRLRAKLLPNDPLLQFAAFSLDFVLSSMYRRPLLVPLTSLTSNFPGSHITALVEIPVGTVPLTVKECESLCETMDFDPVSDAEMCYVRSLGNLVMVSPASVQQIQTLRFLVSPFKPQACFVVMDRDRDAWGTPMLADFVLDPDHPTIDEARFCDISRSLPTKYTWTEIAGLVEMFITRRTFSPYIQQTVKAEFTKVEKVLNAVKRNSENLSSILKNCAPVLNDEEFRSDHEAV